MSQTPKIVEKLRKQLPAIAPEAKIFVKELQQGDDLEAPVEVRISGDDDATLRSIADQVDNILRTTPGASYIHTDWHEAQLQTRMNLNDEVASRLGFTNANIAQQLAAGVRAVRFDLLEGDRNIDIALRLALSRAEELPECLRRLHSVADDGRQHAVERYCLACSRMAVGPHCSSQRRPHPYGRSLR